MKFIYEYRTSDNVRHDGIINATDREGAFMALKAQGIRPGRLVEAPGLFNKLFGRGKRWIAIVLLFLAASSAIVIAIRAQNNVRLAMKEFDAKTRRQIIGDEAVIEKGVRSGWAEVFPEEGERFLASFAIPGVEAAVKSTTEEKIREALGRAVALEPSDTLEVRQIKSLVEGMKEEARDFLSDGGTIVAYGKRLVERQEQELSYYNLAKREIENAVRSGRSDDEVMRLWEECNVKLRKMGVRLVRLPE